MASVNDILAKVNRKLDLLNRKISAFFNFVLNKLKNFKNLSLGEQIAYCCVGAGLLLIFISIILFII